MAYTDQQAQAYYNTLPQGEKSRVDASGGPSVAWLTNAVNAGAPDALKAVGGTSEGGTQAEEGGNVADWQQAAPSSEWMGKRKPTAQELRKWAIETGRSEDYKRFPDTAVSGWIDRNWDVGKGAFVNDYGDLVDKPDERGPNTPAGVNGTGDKGAWDMPGAGGGGGAAKAPAAPVTFGNQLSLTGNPMQDMLISQFNTGQNSTYQQGNNIFGLGEDRAVGGTGANADQQSQNKAQSLGGGGLWWGQGDFNSGLDSSKKNSDLASVPSGAQPPAQPTPQTGGADPAAAKQSTTGQVGIPQTFAAQPPGTQNIGGMMYNQFNPAKPKPQNPLGQGF